MRFEFNKAVEAIVYVAERAPIPDVYHVLKILYFADKQHLDEYGRQILGDQYIAMRAGPVPSQSYDVVKEVRGDRPLTHGGEAALAAFRVERGNDHKITPLRDFEDDFFSPSEIRCIDQAIASYGNLPFAELCRLSHDEAWTQSDANDEIALRHIVSSLPAGEMLREYLSEKSRL